MPSDNGSEGETLSSFLKEKAPTMSRILQEEEERTAALAAGDGGDAMDLEFIDDDEDTGDAPGDNLNAAAPEDDVADDEPFVIVEEESFDISFDNLGEEEDAVEPEHRAQDLNDSELDGRDEDDDDLGPPLPDLSDPVAESFPETDPFAPEAGTVDPPILEAEEFEAVGESEAPAKVSAKNGDDDLPDIEFVDDEGEDKSADPPPAAETPDGAEPLELTQFDEGLDIAFEDAPAEESHVEQAEAPAAAQSPDDGEMDGLEDGTAEIEMVALDSGDAVEPNQTAIDVPVSEDEFAGWGDDEDDASGEQIDESEAGTDYAGEDSTGDGDDDADLGPPLPDLSAPAEPTEDATEQAPDEDAWPDAADFPDADLPDADLEEPPQADISEANPGGEEAEDELTLEIEGLAFEPGNAAGAAPAPIAEPASTVEPVPDKPPEAAPGVAEPAKPVSVQEALMAAIELHRIGDLEGAAQGYEMLVRRFPKSAAGWVNLGIVLRRLGKLDASLTCLRRGVMLNPKDGGAWSNLGNALRAANYLEDAKRAQLKAISLAPGAAQIHYNMGLVTRDFGELAEADACFRRADLLGYSNPDLAWDRSLNLLLSGNLEQGFEAYEARWNLPETPQRYSHLPRWQGDMQKDKTVVIHAEQGLGDSLQFCRYVPSLKSRVGRLIFEVQPQLADLLNSSSWFQGVEIHAREEAAVEADMQMPLLSATVLLPLGESVLPGRDPYLAAPAEGPRIRDDLPGPRVGIAWAGKPTHKNDANRSAGLSTFTALFDVLNVRFYSLQVGPAQSQIRSLSLNSVVQDLSPAIRSFADTASLMQDLDLIVTVDTSVAHLAGAMGKPVWVVLPFSPDWRWQLRRQDSPWYPSMRLFRQTRPGDWDDVFMRLRAALDDWLEDGSGKKP